MESGKTDAFEGGCPVDQVTSICKACHKWTFEEKFNFHVATAAIDMQEGSFLHGDKVDDFVLCERSGCELCKTVLASIRQQLRTDSAHHEQINGSSHCSLFLLPDTPGRTIKIILETDLIMLRIDMRLVQCENIRVEDNVEKTRWVLDSPYNECLEDTTCFEVPPSDKAFRIDTAQIASRIETWLEHCKSSHHVCSNQYQSSGEQEQEFRLLFLGDAASTNVRLVDANLASSEAGYVTMSHRWDPSTKATETTLANVGDAYRNVVLEAYPTHFQEAIRLTKRLGFKHIWIDSLCIIQDCPSDWSKQAKLMHCIYSHGTLNLAFLGDSTLEAPTKQVCTDTDVLGCIVPIKRSRGVSQNLLCWKPDNFDRTLEHSELYSRGWTFQERALSPRTVHFGNQLYWECCTSRASTTFPCGVDYPGNFADDFIVRFKQLLPKRFKGAPQALHSLWCSIVREYSRRGLARPSDRLVALNGVATRLREVFSLDEDQYIYGLWKPGLPEQLLWGFEEDQRPETGHTDAGPSWSWVSHMGPNKFVSTYLGSTIFRERLADVDGLSGDGERACSLNQLGNHKSKWSSLSLSGILIPVDVSMLSRLAIELDHPIDESASHVCLLPILADMEIIRGLVLQKASNRGDSPCDCPVFRRRGLFHGSQAEVVRMFCKEQVSTTSFDWASQRMLRGSALILIS